MTTPREARTSAPPEEPGSERGDAADIQRSDAAVSPADTQRSDAAVSPADTGAPQARKSFARRALGWALQGVVVVLIFLGASHYRTRTLLPSDGSQQAPQLQLAMLDGSRFDLEALRGKRVLVHFWATWCGVCLQELGTLNRLHDALEPDEALITVVADGDDPEAIRRFVKEHQIRYPVLLGDAAAIAAYRVQAFPTNYYLDAEGRIRGTDVGMSTRIGMQWRIAGAK
ncbi:MAG: TlpA family protein disulfide reductase [Polyangiaceae bacterium]|nr:TlpA family protein disulfide reductase [Polyangiaceae bacterium]MCW5788815.1 TlpA family protein disulfide reductase [Polyangiaceae bacterium]